MPSTVDGEGFHSIALEGPATIYEVAALRESLLAALEQPGDVRIDLGDSGKWDIAGLQLLISCVNTGREQGRNVRLTRVPGVCREVASRSGLSEWLATVSD